MRRMFPGYYRPTKEEFTKLWEECLFVLDANVLLNMYRYSLATREELMGILQQISSRIWVPHQVAFEYHQRRLSVIFDQTSAYDKIQESMDKAQKQLENEFRSFKRHPLIDTEKLLQRVRRTFNSIRGDLEDNKKNHPDLIFDDPLKDSLTALLQEKVGNPYTPEKLHQIYEEGKTRFEKHTPPGFNDAGKGGEDMTKQYGDLVLWYQIIDKAKATGKPIIFVTDDRKDDWWWRFNGKTIGPRCELIEEMLSEAGVSFYAYQADPFMENAKDYLNRQIKQEAIDEVREVRQRDESILSIDEAINDFSDSPVVDAQNSKVSRVSLGKGILVDNFSPLVQQNQVLKEMQKAVAPILLDLSGIVKQSEAMKAALDSIQPLQPPVVLDLSGIVKQSELLKVMQESVASSFARYLLQNSNLLKAFQETAATSLVSQNTQLDHTQFDFNNESDTPSVIPVSKP